MKYTQQEIKQRLKSLQQQKHELEKQKLSITKEINSIKEKLEYWYSIDKSQTKLF